MCECAHPCSYKTHMYAPKSFQSGSSKGHQERAPYHPTLGLQTDMTLHIWILRTELQSLARAECSESLTFASADLRGGLFKVPTHTVALNKGEKGRCLRYTSPCFRSLHPKNWCNLRRRRRNAPLKGVSIQEIASEVSDRNMVCFLSFQSCLPSALATFG